jgi:hypothetical protein
LDQHASSSNVTLGDEGIVRTIRNYGEIRSSVRVVKCSLQWGNGRNPCCLLHVSGETARLSREEGGDDAKSAWPFDALGHTRATMERTTGREAAR